MVCLDLNMDMQWPIPMHLVIWEAQFGDFCNGAQTIIDQFIAPENKNGTDERAGYLLLPHGYEARVRNTAAQEWNDFYKCVLN